MRRLPSAKILIYILFFSVFVNFGLSQTDTLTIATYNLLNYPGTDASVRNPYFRAVIHSMKPDILFVQEMTSQTGVNTFLNEVMNKYQSGLYSTVPFNDGPDTDNSVFYRSDKVTFLGAYYISTSLRRIAEYTFRHNLSGEEFRIYSLHFKAAQGYEQDRLAEATILRNYLNNLPTGTNFIVGGDFNIYASTEPAYQKLIGSEADNDGRCFDPKPITGVWNQAAYAIHHTQSTRVRAFGGGSTGGLDDRFDMQLISESMLDNIIVASYKAYGNDGYHYNDSINKLPNYAVPDSVAHGLHYSSDHLPVVAKYVFAALSTFNLLSPTNNSTGIPVNGMLIWSRSQGATGYDVYLSTTNPPATVVSSNQTDTTYNYSGLIYNTKYYWKVVAKKGTFNLDAVGSPYNFTTIVPAPPTSFVLLSPADKSVDQPRNGILSWSSSSTATSYDVYLDTVSNPTTIVSFNQTELNYYYQNLIANKTYFWKVVAKNDFGSTQASNSPWEFKIANVPLAPSNLVVENKYSDKVQLQWVDNSNNELGYRVYRYIGVNKVNVSGDLPANTTSYLDTGLTPNTHYTYEVLAFNAQGEGNFATLGTFTLAAKPTILDKFTYGTSTIFLSIGAQNNPSYTLYSVLVTEDTLTESYVQLDGSRSSIQFWQTVSQWHSSGPVRVINLYPDILYYLKIIAKNQEGIEAFSEFDTISIQPFSINTDVSVGWNLVSVPVHRNDMRKITIFPDAISNAFAYENFYKVKDTLQNGVGYWIKYRNNQIVEFSGTPIENDTFYLNPGWNLIGSISSPVALNNVVQYPEQLIVSYVYGYNGGYIISDTIKPGRAYWLKTNAAGYLILDANNKFGKKNQIYKYNFDNLNQIEIKTTDGAKQALHFGSDFVVDEGLTEMPPIPPGNVFAARFESSKIAADFKKKNEYKLILENPTDNLEIEWRIIDNNSYELMDEQGNIYLLMSSIGSGKINIEDVNSLYLKKKSNYSMTVIDEFELSQNYPNPFNPNTVIEYTIPEDAFVKLEIYNLLGSKVATIVNENKTAGKHKVDFDANNLAGGVYIYKLTAGNLTNFKKMIIIK